MSRYAISVFEYEASLALDRAAAIHREAGRLCQCSHLMHVGRCREINPVQSTPTAFAHAFCQCTRSKLMGEPSSCVSKGCHKPTRVIDGIATFTCENCWSKREATINRGLETFDARHRRGRR
jgi:hypothetical protein